MRIRGLNLAELDDVEVVAGAERQDASKKQYRRHRSLRTARRSSSRMGATQPAVGIAGRRNRRWSW